MSTYFSEHCKTYSNNSLTKSGGRSKTVSAAVSQNIRHCLRLIEAKNSVTDASKSVANKVYRLAPNIVSVKDGTEAKDFDFFGKPMFAKENRGQCEVTFDDYMSSTIQDRCVPGAKINNTTVQVIDFVLQVGRGNRPVGFTYDAWAEKTVEWAEGLLGKDNIILAVLHQDEGSPHMHILATPIVDGHFRGYHFSGKQSINKAVRESYLKKMDEMGFKRPLPPIKRSYAREVEAYRQEMDRRLVEVAYPQPNETIVEQGERLRDAYEKCSAKLQADYQRKKDAFDTAKRALFARETEADKKFADILAREELIAAEDARIRAEKEAYREECRIGEAILYARKNGLIAPRDDAVIEGVIERAERDRAEQER